MDAPSVKIGESVVDVTNMYWKGEPLILTIKCPKPSPTQPDYSVSAVLNLGGKPDGNSWIRKGDYLNDTMHHRVCLMCEPASHASHCASHASHASQVASHASHASQGASHEK